MHKVRFGIIGYGNMGSGHGKSFFEGKVKDGVLTAVCDKNPEKLALAQQEHEKHDYAQQVGSTLKVFDHAEAMFDSGEIDAVIISVPHYDHPPLAILAFKKGIHVMCEKPAGVYTKQVREMNAAAEKSNVVFAMMFNQRTNCVYRKMKEMVDNGEIGELRRSNWIITNWYRPQAYYDSGDWRATWSGEGGGVLLNQCPHNLDLWQWICGMPTTVRAFAHEGKWHDIEVEDDVTAYVEYANGATGVFVTSTADTPGTNRFELTGTKGKLVCENNRLTFTKLEVSEPEFSKTNKVAFTQPNSTTEEVETDGENPQHVAVLSAFAARILRGEPLVAEGKEGIFGLTLSNAMHFSSWTNSTVTLPLDEDLFYEELKKRIKTSRRKEYVMSGGVVDLSSTYNA